MYHDIIADISIAATSSIIIPFSISFKLNGKLIKSISKVDSTHSTNTIKLLSDTNDTYAQADVLVSGMFLIIAINVMNVVAISVTGTVKFVFMSAGYKYSNTNLFIQTINKLSDTIVLNILGDAISVFLNSENTMINTIATNGPIKNISDIQFICNSNDVHVNHIDIGKPIIRDSDNDID